MGLAGVPIICQGIPARHPLFFDLSLFFFSLSPAIFGFPFRVCARKYRLLESLFLDKNSNQIDLLILNLIIFILCDGSSIGWVAVAVADAGGVDGRFRCGGGSICRSGGGCGGGGAAVWGLDFGGGLMTVLDSFSAKLPNHGNRDSHVNTFPLFQQSLEKAGIATRSNLPPLARPSIV